MVRRSSRDIPSHLDYREVETNDKEGEASVNVVSENEMIEQVTEVINVVDDEEDENVSQSQKREPWTL